MTRAPLHRPAARWLAAAAVALLLVLAWAATASAQQPDNSSCLSCHTQPGLTMKLANGDVLPLTVDPTTYNKSVHGQQNLACTACHTNITGYPHPTVTAGDRRSFQLERYTQCQTCHQKEYQDSLDSNHARALAAGNRDAAICTDCHGAHDISVPDSPRQKISTTCAKCHSVIYNQYISSVHGAALATGNPDVPVCTDCHGAHKQQDPTTAAFRNDTPALCAKCHANATLMRQYNISTDVFNTYVADFHGTTIEVFAKTSPNQASNKAVCTDCHGIHDIKRVTASDATVVKQNLLVTCQKCHPDATTNFPDSWVGHFPPSAQNHALIYYVNLFYKILIPAVIGAMLLFVVLDAIRRIHNRLQHREA
jgi:predicted CXXCH cytochrome family protein